jgi:integrase
MPHAKLTEKAISKLRAPTATGVQELWFDTELRGFAVRCSGTTSAKSYIVQRDLPGGTTRRFTIASVAEMKLTEAREQARELLVNMRRGVDPKRRGSGQRTLHQTLEAYLQANKELRPRSRATYSYLVERHLAPWKDRPIGSISPADVDELHDAIAAEVSRRGLHDGHNTANHAIRHFKRLYDWAARRDDSLGKNPVRLERREWHKVEPERRPIPFEKLPTFYAAVMRQPPIGRDLLLVMLYSGFRREEALKLRWDEVDLGRRIIRLPPERNKSGREFVLPMSDLLADLLIARRKLGDAKFVFPSYGSAGHVINARPWIDAVATEIEHRFSAHDLRRTFLSIAESSGISVYAMKALANHAIDSAIGADDFGADVTAVYVEKSVKAVENLRESAHKVANRIKTLCDIDAPSGDKVVVLR